VCINACIAANFHRATQDYEQLQVTHAHLSSEFARIDDRRLVLEKERAALDARVDSLQAQCARQADDLSTARASVVIGTPRADEHALADAEQRAVLAEQRREAVDIELAQLRQAHQVLLVDKQHVHAALDAARTAQAAAEQRQRLKETEIEEEYRRRLKLQTELMTANKTIDDLRAKESTVIRVSAYARACELTPHRNLATSAMKFWHYAPNSRRYNVRATPMRYS
jgi:chromosome segregation ATPase